MPGNIYRCSVRVYKASKDVKLSRCTRMKRGRPCLRQYGRKFFNLGGSNGLFYQSIRVFSDFLSEGLFDDGFLIEMYGLVVAEVGDKLSLLH